MTDDQPILAPGAVALVTGASAGFGVAIAEALVAKGCRVIAAARRLDRLRALGKRLGPNCHPLTLDVTDAAATENLIERLPEDLRAIDILVNNAGHDTGGRRRFDQGDMAQWASIVETNVTGLMRVTGAVAPGMVERDRGHIVNLGSISGFKPYAGGTVYAASKFAVHGFTASLRADYVGTGIRVTEILPGTARTEFGETRWRGDKARAKAFYDGYQTLLDAEDIARCVVFALEQPAHVVISELVVMPTSQW